MLKIQNICYSVFNNGNEKQILKDISLTINDNELLVITGQNGSGKSTLAKIVMGILTPTSGKIIFNDQDITNLSITERAKMGFSYGFQQPILFKGLTVQNLIDIASGKKNNISELCSILSKVGLCAKEYLNRQLDNKLSGGELKRIELAMVLAKNGTLNIFDEPEAGIDIWSFDAMVKLFKESKTTNIIISHQQKLIEIANRVVLLKQGKVEKVGTYNELKSTIENEQCSQIRGEANGQN